ncbi:exported hypothetical protein [Candidatus Sulfopaludibacter sp. SbA3]|nr:exported hypothetical protein [Candidatus Sulfopaludibacter sp. SbA3]
MTRWSSLWILTLGLAYPVAPALANLVSDPGFESCTLVAQEPPDWALSAYCSFDPHTRSWGANFSGSSLLSQTISTMAGTSYDFSFWLDPIATSPDSFTASFGADEVLNLLNQTPGSYRKEQFTVSATGCAT